MLGAHTCLVGVRPGRDLPGPWGGVCSSLLDVLLSCEQQKEPLVTGVQKEALLFSALAVKGDVATFGAVPHPLRF